MENYFKPRWGEHQKDVLWWLKEDYSFNNTQHVTQLLAIYCKIRFLFMLILLVHSQFQYATQGVKNMQVLTHYIYTKMGVSMIIRSDFDPLDIL